jgi:hypothetical protein
MLRVSVLKDYHQALTEGFRVFIRYLRADAGVAAVIQ